MTDKTTESVQRRGVMRDFTEALGQQMFFWGRDVIHTEGNLLCEFGLDRRKSGGLAGTSCYQMEYAGCLIELHGACVGQYSANKPGFLYIRTRKRCFLYKGEQPPDPGTYDEDRFPEYSVDRVQSAGLDFLKWWLEYESWITKMTSRNYRQNCYTAYKKLPKAHSWLPPEMGLEWLRAYAAEPDSVARARRWKREYSYI